MLNGEHDTGKLPARGGFLEHSEITSFVGGEEERKAVIALGLVVLTRS